MASQKAITGLVGGGVLVGITWATAYYVHQEMNPPTSFALTTLIGVAGVAVGWLVGFLASPYSDEVDTFARYASLISLFFSGYALAKLEPSIAYVFSEGRLVKEALLGLRVLVFGICFVAAAITMYVFRLYTGPNSPDLIPEAARDRRPTHA